MRVADLLRPDLERYPALLLPRIIGQNQSQGWPRFKERRSEPHLSVEGMENHMLHL